MSLSPDRRLAVALRDEGRARTTLGELHQQIIACRDERALWGLLAKYSAIALAKQTLTARPSLLRAPSGSDLVVQNALQMESRMFTTLSNVSKAKHDAAKSTIQNIRG